MRKKRPVLPLVLAVILAVGMFQPMPAAAANLYFTGINDSVAPLTSSSMPYWSGGTLYVPYTVFDANQNGVGVSLGLYTSYNHRSHIVTIFNLKQMLVFDLERGTCRDDMTGAAYDAQAVMRYGKPYVPLYVVCSVFGLEYSYNQLSYISQGYLVRIKSADAVLDDGLFIDRARELINNRLRDYTQSLSPAETTPTIPVSPSEPPEVDGGNVATYLAFRCESADGLSAILNTLDGTGQYALSRGRLALEELAHTRTTLAYVPDGARAGLEEQGWVCWKETLYLEPGDSVGGTAFAGTVLNRLGTRRRTVYLTLEGSGNTARVLSALLRQLSSNHYTVAVPMETRL